MISDSLQGQKPKISGFENQYQFGILSSPSPWKMAGHCMLRIGKMTDYALVIMNRMAKHPARLQRMEELADATRLGLPTVRKLMRQLVAAGLVRSERGAKGGYQLSRLPDMISIAQIVTAVEGPLAITECCVDDGDCELSGGCEVESHMPTLNELIVQILSNISLTDLSSMGSGVHHNMETIISRLLERGAMQCASMP